ncbi:C40 family peptidase [Modestobacter sp. Leaf380]|uniref:C40 family peptidase n=1 Tax=Modestobacter sp. Leaf380 TaxID=1736356 RepID=UPI0007004DDD|nr:NlpC/P60 family protein [Modestobacter sp. Leaf380]KQS73265.1 hypothetical protein ASG41_00800 [Modestobacter sp. Leaf380]
MATTHPTELDQHHTSNDHPRDHRSPLRSRLARVLVTGAAAATLSVGVLPGTASARTAAPVAATAAAGQSPAAQAAVDAAMTQVGKGYAYGGNGPDAYDCSGLTTAAYAAAGVALPRTSSAQSQVGTPVSRADLVPGDLVFFYSPVSHVGIYVGDGQMVNALNSSTGVVVSSVDMPGFAGASRIA